MTMPGDEKSVRAPALIVHEIMEKLEMTKDWRLLLVEDDEDDYILTRDLFAEIDGRVTVDWAADYESGMAKVVENQYDAVLVDYYLGSKTGLDFTRELVSQDRRVPIILLTGRGSYEIDLEAMKAGVTDYLVKGEVNPYLLERAIRYAIERHHNEQALLQAKNELEERVQERTRELRQSNQRLKEAYEVLLESEQRLRALVTSTPVILWVVNRERRFTLVEGKGLENLGLSPGALIGKPAFDLLEAGPEIEACLDKALAGFEATSVGTAVVAPGEWLETRCSPYYNQEGEVVGVIGLSLVVTERIQAEQELAEIQRRLTDSVENERLQLAQELHDGPMQDLYALTYEIQALRSGLSEEEAAEFVPAYQNKIQDVVSALRVIVGELRPPTLTSFGLEKAIRSHAEQFLAGQPGLQVALDLMPDGQTLSERQRISLFRIYQVALTNVVRHAQAKHVRVRLALEDEKVFLEVEDDGCGFSVPENWVEMARQGHLGLVGAFERAGGIGGRLDVESHPGKGTRIRVVAPVER